MSTLLTSDLALLLYVFVLMLAAIFVAKYLQRIKKKQMKTYLGKVRLKARDGNRVYIIVGGTDPAQVAQVTNQIRYWFRQVKTNTGVDWDQLEDNMAVVEKAMAAVGSAMDGVFRGIFK